MYVILFVVVILCCENLAPEALICITGQCFHLQGGSSELFVGYCVNTAGEETDSCTNLGS